MACNVEDLGSVGDTLLIYAPVPLYRKDGIFYQEDQACNGLRLWAENFERVLAIQPLAVGDPPPAWVPLNAGVGANMARIEVHPVPMAYRPDQFVRHFRRVRRQIRALIERADYMSFAIGGLFGDWGAVSCLEAHRMNRPFAVWTDRVESQVMRRAMESGSLKSRIRARLYHRPMAWLERKVIAKATLGLFHGRDTFEAYAPFCREPQLVHDIHLKISDHIPPHRLNDKIAQAAAGPVKLAYVGRADPPKGPLDWVAVTERLAEAGIDFRATWLGDGQDHAAMTARLVEIGLADRVAMPGHVTDRAQVLETLRDAHLFMFCHKTQESPRCLIEALASATPIVGYTSAYSRDLISAHGGGLLCPLDDVAALSDAIVGLAADRTALADLIVRASRDGAPFTDESVFHHRSALIRQFL